jgi:hypothetical protein
MKGSSSNRSFQKLWDSGSWFERHYGLKICKGVACRRFLGVCGRRLGMCRWWVRSRSAASSRRAPITCNPLIRPHATVDAYIIRPPKWAPQICSRGSGCLDGGSVLGPAASSRRAPITCDPLITPHDSRGTLISSVHPNGSQLCSRGLGVQKTEDNLLKLIYLRNEPSRLLL